MILRKVLLATILIIGVSIFQPIPELIICITVALKVESVNSYLDILIITYSGV